MDSENGIYEELIAMFPDIDPDVILTVLLSYDYSAEQSINVLINYENNPEQAVDLPVEEDYDRMLAEIIQAELNGEGEFQAQARQIIQESVLEPRQGEAPAGEKKPGFSKRFKAKLSSLFRKKNQLEKANNQDLQDVELTTFKVQGQPQP